MISESLLHQFRKVINEDERERAIVKIKTTLEIYRFHFDQSLAYERALHKIKSHKLPIYQEIKYYLDNKRRLCKEMDAEINNLVNHLNMFYAKEGK